MQRIFLQNHWHGLISSDNTPYFDPTLDDQTWQSLNIVPALQANERWWMRHWFEMPPNDECSTWWLEFDVPPSPGTQVWVNYEPIDLAQPADITYAVFMGKNVVTVCVTEGEQWQKYTEIPKIALVPRPCLL